MNIVQQNLLTALLNWEEQRRNDRDEQLYKMILIAPHPQRTNAILEMFKRAKDENVEDYPDELIDTESVDIEGMNINDIMAEILEFGYSLESNSDQDQTLPS